jgi:hypothetical protein
MRIRVSLPVLFFIVTNITNITNTIIVKGISSIGGATVLHTEG